MDVNRLLDETVEKDADLDGFISRKASLKIQKATGKNLPEFVKKNMEGMTEAQRNEYRKKLLAQRKAQVNRQTARQDAQNKMKQAVIQRKIRNSNLLSSWKERRKVQQQKVLLAKKKMQIQKEIANKNREESKALAVRNATHPGTVMAQAERSRVMSARAKSSEIMNGKKDKFQPGNEQALENARNHAKVLKAGRGSGRVRPVGPRKAMTPEQRIERTHAMIARINEKMGSDPKNQEKYAKLIQRLQNSLQKIQQARVAGYFGLGSIGKMSSTECENLRATIKRQFLETVAKSRGTTDPADKMNIMRQFWDRWQPILSIKPELYNWFKSDEHIRNAMMDFKGLGEWDQFTPTETKYLSGTTTDNERAFLLGERPGEVNAYTSMHPLADELWDVEDLMPNVPAVQPTLSNIDVDSKTGFPSSKRSKFPQRFDTNQLMKTRTPVTGPQLPNRSSRRMGSKRRVKRGTTTGRRRR